MIGIILVMSFSFNLTSVEELQQALNFDNWKTFIIIAGIISLLVAVVFAKMKLRSFKEKCICEKKARTSKKSKLFALKKSGDFSDKILMSSDHQEIPVHRLIMASLSPSFSDVMKSTDTTTIIPFTKKIIEILVMFAYTGSSRLDEFTIMETLEAADKYKIKELVQLSGDFLISSALNVSNSLRFYDLSVKFCCEHVIGKISKFICQNFKGFIVTGQALSFTAEQVSMFVQSVDLQMNVEELEHFIQAWAEANVNTYTMGQMDAIMHSISLKRIPDKVVLATGGFSLQPTDVIETFNYLTKSWSINHIKLPVNSSSHGVVELEGKLYIVGGYDGQQTLESLYCLDVSTMVWEEMSSMMSKREGLSTAVIGGNIFALGGYDGSSILKTVEMYDPSTNMWTEMPSMKHRRCSFGTTVLEGKLFAVGGFDDHGALSSVEYFCPIEGDWVETSPLITPRYEAAAVTIEDKILVLGGRDETETLKSVECFQLGISRAVRFQVPDMLHRRSDFSSFVLEGKVVVVGGYEKGNVFSTEDELCADVEEYCSKEKKWSSGSNLNIRRSALGCVVFNNNNGFKI